MDVMFGTAQGVCQIPLIEVELLYLWRELAYHRMMQCTITQAHGNQH